MKRIIAILVFVSAVNTLHAEFNSFRWDVSHWILSGGAGMSNILVDGTSFQAIFDPKLRLSPALTLGNKNGFNVSTDGIITLETQAFLRWNILGFPARDPGFFQQYFNIFVQGGVGLLGSIKGPDDLDVPNKKKTRASLLFDGTLGVTLPLGRRWVIEPAIRGGYPFILGATLTAGYKFPLPQKTVYQEGPIRVEYQDRIEYQDRVEYQEKIVYQDRVEYRDKIEYVKVPITNEIIRHIMISQVDYVLFGPDISNYNMGIDADGRSLNDLVLSSIVKTLKDDPHSRVRVEGHANPVTRSPGEIQELSALSANRAYEIARLLRQKGVAENQIIVVALGGTRTLTGEQARWNMNRRVELIVFQGEIN